MKRDEARQQNIMEFKEIERYLVKTPIPVSDASLFYTAPYQDSEDLVEWINFLKRKRKPYILAKGIPTRQRRKEYATPKYCLFIPPGWDDHDGQRGKYTLLGEGEIHVRI